MSKPLTNSKSHESKAATPTTLTPDRPNGSLWSIGRADAPCALSFRPWGWFFAAALTVAVFLAYQPAWRGGLIWDDDCHVTRPEFRSWHGLYRIWFDIGATAQYYPLVHSAFWVEYKLWGDATLGYHLINIFLHATAALMVALILRRLAIPGAYLAAAIFALHPVQVESVAWITELKNTLSGVFYLAAMLSYLQFDQTRSRRWYALALGLFVCALLSKTAVATLPGALLVIFWWQRGRLSWHKDIMPMVPLFLIGASGGLVSAWWELKFNNCVGPEFDRTLAERFLIAGRAAWFQLGTLFWPANQAFIYPRWRIDQTAMWQYLYPLAAIVLLAALWSIRRWSRAPLAAVLFFGGTLFPVLGFFKLYTFRYSFVADHYQYLACLGIITLTSAIVMLLLERFGPRGRLVGRVLCLALLAILAGLTWRQARMYSDIITLYRTTLVRNPECPMAHNNLGTVLNAQGHHKEAIAHYQKAVRLKPDDAGAHHNWGNALNAMGRPQEAIVHFKDAVQLKSDYVEAHLSWGGALHGMGSPQEAIEHYQEALRIKPDCTEAHSNWGNSLNALGRHQESMVQCQLALRLKPDNFEAHNNWGNALEALGRPQEAIEHYQEALRIKPDCAEAHNNWGNALHALGRSQDSVLHYQRALQIKPDYFEAHFNWGNALVTQGQLVDAVGHFQEALRLKPDLKQATDNLLWVEKLLQQKDAKKPPSNP